MKNDLVGFVIGSLLYVMSLTAGPVLAADGVTIIKGGNAQAAVVIPDDADETLQLAARELVEHLQLMSGATLQVLSAGQLVDNGMIAIHLGSAADPELVAINDNVSKDIGTFTLRVTPQRIDIRGQSSDGTLFGVYELLEQLGFRWYMPGEFGRVVPHDQTVTLRTQETTQSPSFGYRALQHIYPGNWSRRARLNLDYRETGSHGFPGLPDELYKTHPELFSLINGKRVLKQHCLSNPETLRRVVEAVREELKANPAKQYVGMGPRDGGGFCECDNCRKLDGGVFDPTANRESMTDRYIWFLNRVLESLPEYPNLHVVKYVYGATMMPPKVVTPNRRFVGVFAPITIDRIRGMDNPMSPDRHLLRWLLDEWSKFDLDEMYFRGYYNNLACPQFPLSQVDTIRNETPVFRDKRITAMRVEVIRPSWATAGLNFYLAARLMWDADTDVDALLVDFYEKFHGPAALPMSQYYEELDRAFKDTPYFTGSSFPYLRIFDDTRREQMRKLLDEASRLAPQGSLYAQRVAAVRLGWDRMETFLDMMAARDQLDMAKAHALMQKFDAQSDEGAGVQLATFESRRSSAQPRLIHEDEGSTSKKSYFTRFFRRPVVEGHRRLVEEGKLVAGLAETWDFLIDPADIGLMAGFPREGKIGGNWQPIHTTQATWSDQGLHYYKGVAWYRQMLTLPEMPKGQRVYLWFGGVDRTASVWVNGQYLGSSREPNEGLPGVPGSFRPFDLDATDAIRPGQENTVVVRIQNDQLSELGTGGIMAPVFFWSPNDPAWKP